MNNPNPFIPQGSLLEQVNKKRARLKLAVYISFGATILVISPLLIQGCKKEAPADTSGSPDLSSASSATTSNAPDTNVPTLPPAASTSAPPAMASNVPPPAPLPPPPPPAPPEPTTREYTVVKGDTIYLIAKNNHIKMKELEAANPGVVPTKLKAGQKLQIPGSGSGGGSSLGSSSPAGETGGEGVYVVRPKDTLSKIAKANGTTVKALRSLNNLRTDGIKVGQKLKLPEKAPAPEPAPAPAPEPAQMPAPVTPAPAPPGAPATGH